MMNKLLANCLIGFCLSLSFISVIQAQIIIIEPDPDICPTRPPGTTDLYCNSANPSSETACENLNVLIYFTPDAINFFENSSSRTQENALATAISNFELAMANSQILNKTITYSVYEAETLDFTRLPDDDPLAARMGCTVQSFYNLSTMTTIKANYNADLMVVIDEDPNNLNYIGGVVSKIGLDANDAFTIMEPRLLGYGSFTFTHELAHLLGARHHFNDHAPDPNFPAGVCQHGWRFTAGFNQKYATIMARSNDANSVPHQRIPYFSNPDVRYFNATTSGTNPSFGTPTGNQFSDNAGWISRSYGDVADFEPLEQIILQHSQADSRDALVQYMAPFFIYQSPLNGTNFGSAESINLTSEMVQGSFNFSFYSKKSVFLDFDWDRIPTNAVITEAKLSLFYNPNDQIESLSPSTHSGNNQFVIQRAAAPWLENTITWNNAPAAVTNSNTITVPQSLSNTQDYENIDVTSLVQEMVSNQATYGFRIDIGAGTNHRKVILASSEHPTPGLRPRLEITFATCAKSLSNKQAPPTTDFVKVYPNPTTDKLSLKFTEAQDSQIALFDLQGKQVLSQQSIGQYDAKISLGHLPKGVYILKVSTEGQQHSQKVILR